MSSNTATPEHGAPKPELKMYTNELPAKDNSLIGRVKPIRQWFRHDGPTLHDTSKSGTKSREPALESELGLSYSLPCQHSKPLGYKGAALNLSKRLTFSRRSPQKRDQRFPQLGSTLSDSRAVNTDFLAHGHGGGKRTSSPRLLPAPSPATDIPASNDNPSYETKLVSPGGDTDMEPNGTSQNFLTLVDSAFPQIDPYCKHCDLEGMVERQIQSELESKWILNQSMTFRNEAGYEKFFATYAQNQNQWRRVTVSVSYENAPRGSLEAELMSSRYQRDKNARIYTVIRHCLHDIAFFDTVTNLRLVTEDGKLNVLITEDIDNSIVYPASSLIEHLRCSYYRESELSFDAHLSGFVYRVRVDNQILIKKEIPGPDSVDDFLYELNALYALQDSRSVIKFYGVVVDQDYSHIKGLLIAFAPRGSLLDMLYDYKRTDRLPWERREFWAYQIVRGLSEIHEAGYVQGDFTLSNVVIDGNDDAKVIDINRRGCPMGWEPPEFLKLAKSGQKIRMLIGVKSDLYQLGMVLWALAEQEDEPESIERIGHRLPPMMRWDVPVWYKRMVETCLSEDTRDRISARELLRGFPPVPDPYGTNVADVEPSGGFFINRHLDEEYPETAGRAEDLEAPGREQSPVRSLSEANEPAHDAAPPSHRYHSDGTRTVPNDDATLGAHSGNASSKTTKVSSARSKRRRVARRDRETAPGDDAATEKSRPDDGPPPASPTGVEQGRLTASSPLFEYIDGTEELSSEAGHIRQDAERSNPVANAWIDLQRSRSPVPRHRHVVEE